MKLPATIKRVPKWAWYTSGGIVLGYGAIHLYNNRTTADAEATSEDTTTAGGTATGVVPSSNGGIIVPPVVMSGGDTESGGTGLADLQALYMGGTEQLIGGYQTFADQLSGGYETLYNPLIGQNASLTGGLYDLLANAGDSPSADTTQPAQASISPILVGSSAQATTGKKSCRQLFPNFPKHATNRGTPSEHSCYNTSCEKKNGKKRVVRHFKNGDNQVTDTKCG